MGRMNGSQRGRRRLEVYIYIRREGEDETDGYGRAYLVEESGDALLHDVEVLLHAQVREGGEEDAVRDAPDLLLRLAMDPTSI